jgi:DNA (cytosine-5)-methyltransferase 1
MKFGSLFTGIGGFDLAFEQAGMTCAWQCEINAAARSVLARHWPDVPIIEDGRAIGAHNLPPVDVICGGFPCQDMSLAGKRAGFAGHRSSLFFEMVRVTYELRPAFLVWENVPGLLSARNGRDFAEVLMALDAIGYCGAWTGLDARYFGLAQRRRRIFGVFAREDIGAGRCAEILSLLHRLRWHPAPRGGEEEDYSAVPGNGVDGGRPYTIDWAAPVTTTTVADPPGTARTLTASRTLAVAYTLPTQAQRNNLDSQTYVAEPHGIRRLTPAEYERLQGFPDGWTAGQSDTQRYRQLGNAVAVPVARWIGTRIMEVLS